MKVMSVRSKGKKSKGNSFTDCEIVEWFPFPYKNEKVEEYREFPSQGKSRENTEIF